MSSAPTIFEATLTNFEQDVIERSRTVPVLVDFWAEWCGPCKSLMPVLEKLAVEYAGRFYLAKVDTDAQGQLAGMFGIRSLPTVVLFRDGQPIDGFMGVQAEGTIRELLDKHVEPAKPLLDTGGDQSADSSPEPRESPQTAIARLQEALREKPDDETLTLDLLAAMIRNGELDEVEARIDSLPARLGEDSRTRQLRGQLNFARELTTAPPARSLVESLDQDPSDLRARHQLGIRLFVEGQFEQAMQQFLEVLRQDRNFEDGLARRSLIAAFDLCDDAALVSAYRRKMASLLF